MTEPSPSEAVADLFGDAIELPPARRRDFVLGSAVPERVRREVLSLLAVHERIDARPDRLDPALAAALLDDGAPFEPEVGRRIGPYRLVRRLGRGGMGVVYLAERADGVYEQSVAIKLLPLALSSDVLERRFLLERRILARLEHPGIARLLDGGVTENGEPYFVLEYVEGERLTCWCDTRCLGVAERLRLFLRVCEGVQYAHGRLVVHRDLKPSNILVTPAGEVKLLDFGIAKLLVDEEGTTGASALTHLGQRPYTPGYAAPEQLRGGAVTVATDVYALGVLLYELLAGRRPDPRRRETHSLYACSPPTRPSIAVGQASEPETEDGGERVVPQEIARVRATDSERLRRRLEGDLDTIALKALRDEPEQRYETALALADDVRRHLEGRAIAARPASVGYRTGRFLRRHRLGTAAAALVALAILGGLIGTAWQARVARQERDSARLEAAKLVAVQEYLVGFFEAADPAESRGEEITARQLVRRGRERLEAELAAQPEVQLELYQVLTRVSRELGDYARAGRLLHDALPRARRLYGDDHVETADLVTLRGTLLHARGEWREAEEVLRRALTIYQRRGADERDEALVALSKLGSALDAQGRSAAAERIYRHSLTLLRRRHGDRSPEVASALNNLGIVLKDRGRLDAAEAALRKALHIVRARFGNDHPELATVMINLAGVLYQQGDLLAAEPYYRRGVDMERKLRGEDHPRYAMKLHNLANLLHATGRYDEAAGLHREVLATLREQFGDNHPYTGAALDSLASDLAAGGRFDEAMPLFERAGRVLRGTAGGEHELYAIHRFRLGAALRDRGDAERAIYLPDEAIAILRRSNGKEHPRVALALCERGRTYLALGDVERSEWDLRAALRIQRRKLPSSHPATAKSLIHLARTMAASDRPERAATLAREGLSMATASLPTEHEIRAQARVILAAAHASPP